VPRRTAGIASRGGRDYGLLALHEIFVFQADGEIVWILPADEKYIAVSSGAASRGAALSSRRWFMTPAGAPEITVSKLQTPVVREILR
jgi:hypothetical protein